ncbi:hypothetical protein ASF91_21710 [Rhizobium sp. Leaf155]|nr:hypothetical protein ASF91_21710 [Rhizobium sp. Leaf155]
MMMLLPWLAKKIAFRLKKVFQIVPLKKRLNTMKYATTAAKSRNAGPPLSSKPASVVPPKGWQ